MLKKLKMRTPGRDELSKLLRSSQRKLAAKVIQKERRNQVFRRNQNISATLQVFKDKEVRKRYDDFKAKTLSSKTMR
jgi:hypothetical protein